MSLYSKHSLNRALFALFGRMIAWSSRLILIWHNHTVQRDLFIAHPQYLEVKCYLSLELRMKERIFCNLKFQGSDEDTVLQTQVGGEMVIWNKLWGNHYLWNGHSWLCILVSKPQLIKIIRKSEAHWGLLIASSQKAQIKCDTRCTWTEIKIVYMCFMQGGHTEKLSKEMYIGYTEPSLYQNII